MNLHFYLFLLVLCLSGTFLFAGSETGFVSLNQIKIRYLAEKGSRLGVWGLFLIKNKNQLLSAILIGSNISVIGASLFFNKVILHFEQIEFLSKIPSPESWILTPFIVLFCEMLPKSLFRLYSFQLTLRFLPILLLAYFLTFPFSWSITFLINKVRKTVKDPERSFKAKSREEMVLVAAEGARTGALFESANLLFNNILQLKNQTVSQLMKSIEYYKSSALIIETDTVSKIKSCNLMKDEIIIFDIQGIKPVGYITILDIATAGSEEPLSPYIRPLMVLEQEMSLISVLKIVIKDSRSIFLVTNHEGLTKGILWKTDLFCAAFGSNKLELHNAFV